MKFKELKGLHIVAFKGCEPGSNEVSLLCSNGDEFTLRPTIKGIIVNDTFGTGNILGKKITEAKLSVYCAPNFSRKGADYFAWCYCQIITDDADFTIRWLAKDDLCYSTFVSIDKVE